MSGEVIEPRRLEVAGRVLRYVVHEPTGRPIKDVTPRERPGHRGRRARDRG